MPKKDRTFAAKLAHEARRLHKHDCPVCGKEQVPIVYYAAMYNRKGDWRPQKRHIKVCDCNREEIYG